MHCNNWIFDMDGTLTDSMTVVWEGAPDALLARYGRTPKSDLHHRFTQVNKIIPWILFQKQGEFFRKIWYTSDRFPKND